MRSSRKRRSTAVLDTNVWVSALIWGGFPAKIIEAAERCEVEIVTSMEIIAEIGETLSHPKLESVYSEAGLNRRDLAEAVLRVARVVEVDVSVDAVEKDPSDDKFIECALAGGADYIVSDDRHLLGLGCYEDVKIVRVGKFLEMLGRPSP